MTPAASTSSMAIYRRLWGYTRRYWPMFLLGIAGVSVDAGMQAAFVEFMGPLIDRVFVGKDSEFGLWLAGVIALISIGRIIGNFAGVYGMEWVGRRVVADLRNILPTSHYQLLL
jgi:subfamily B ATP-binding cassette protein MsbA